MFLAIAALFAPTLIAVAADAQSSRTLRVVNGHEFRPTAEMCLASRALEGHVGHPGPLMRSPPFLPPLGTGASRPVVRSAENGQKFPTAAKHAGEIIEFVVRIHSYGFRMEIWKYGSPMEMQKVDGREGVRRTQKHIYGSKCVYCHLSALEYFGVYLL